MSVVERTGLNIKKLKWLQNKAHLSFLKIFPKYYSGLSKQNKTKQNKTKQSQLSILMSERENNALNT